MRTLAVLCAIAMAVSLIPGCPPKKPPTIVEEPDYARPLKPGQLALAKITDPKDIPSFKEACSNRTMLRESILNSLNYLGKASSQRYFPYGTISHEQAVASLNAMLAMLDSNMPAADMDAAIREKCDVYVSVGWNGYGEVLFTGYYTPIFDARPAPDAKFKYPLYKKPADLVDLGDGNYQKWFDRKSLDTTAKSKLAGLELYYLSDPYEVYVAQIQGSAKLRMADGQLVGIGYAGNNGYEYVSPNPQLVAEGKIPKGKVTLPALITYFKAHPNEVQEYTWRNPRYVFFVEQTGEARGCLNEPVTAWRSIATDKSIFPRGCLAMAVTKVPAGTGEAITSVPFSNWALDQDAGGAIRAPGRCDIYMGVGDGADKLAGREYETGKLYYVFLKPGTTMPGSLKPTTLPPSGDSKIPVPAPIVAPGTPGAAAPRPSTPPAPIAPPVTTTPPATAPPPVVLPPVDIPHSSRPPEPAGPAIQTIGAN